MMNALRITFSISCFVFFCFKIACSTLEEPTLGEFLSKETTNLELKPMFSANYDAQVNGKVVELKEFFDKYNSVCAGALQKYENLVKTVNNYIQRYVSLFLLTCGIFDGERKDSNGMITVNLEITISPEEFAYLQDIPKKSEGSLLRDLSKLEVILSRVAKRRETNYLEWTLWSLGGSFLSFLWWIFYHLPFKSNLYYFAPFLTILLITFIIYFFSPRRSFYVYLSIIINSMIVWDGLNLYRRKIKDVEVELETLKLQTMMPAECDPQNVKWYHALTNIFTGNKCLEYNKNVNRNPSDEVSLFKCLVDTYSFHTVQAASRVLGASIRDFAGEVTALWPKPIQWFVSLPLLPFVISLAAFFILILFGKRLKLSFLGASVEIGDSSAVIKNRKVSKTSSRSIAGCRPLRIMAKSRLFRRSELNLAKERKCNLRDSKSESAIDRRIVNVAEPIAASSSSIKINKTDDYF